MWEWFDPAITSVYLKQILIDLRDTVKSLKREKMEIMEEKVAASSELEEMKREIDTLRSALHSKDTLIADLCLELSKRGDRIHMLFSPKICVAVVFCFVVLLIAMK